MVAFLPKLIITILILVFDVISLLLFVIGFGLGDYLSDDVDGSDREADPARFYFTWTLLSWIGTVACLVVGVFVPMEFIRRFVIMGSIIFCSMMLFVLTNILANTIDIVVFDDCGDTPPSAGLPPPGPKDSSAEAACHACKLVLVSVLFWCATKSLQIGLSVLLLADREEESK